MEESDYILTSKLIFSFLLFMKQVNPYDEIKDSISCP